MPDCKYCKITIPNSKDMGAHTRWCDMNPSKVVGKNSKPKLCIRCGTLFIHKRRKTCSDKCANIMTDDMKKSISKGRTKFLSENPDQHPWKSAGKHISIPCQNVKDYLESKNIEYVSEFTPLKGRAYSVDIAFPHIKVGIEINGNQHYNSDGELKPYYQERHDLIEADGWRLLEVHYSQCFSEQTIQEFLNFEIPYDKDEVIKAYFQKKADRDLEKLQNPTMPRGQKIAKKTREKWESRKDEIFLHNIDFSSFGWVTKVSKVLGITPQKVNSWMKTYQPSFYEEECFKKKK